MNVCIFKGRLARDVELRYTQNGKAVATFSVAVNRPKNSKDGNAQTADFIPCIAWDKRGEAISNYLVKGSEILVTTHVQIRSYDDKQGNKRYVTEFIVDNFEFVGSKGNNQQGDGFSGGFSAGSMSAPSDDDIPF